MFFVFFSFLFCFFIKKKNKKNVLQWKKNILKKLKCLQVTKIKLRGKRRRKMYSKVVKLFLKYNR